MLAHGFSHSVPGISLPPGDANLGPHYLASWSSGVKRISLEPSSSPLESSQTWEVVVDTLLKMFTQVLYI